MSRIISWFSCGAASAVATKLAISVEELHGYLNAPKRTYKDFRSQAWLYNIGARVMKGLRLEIGGKR